MKKLFAMAAVVAAMSLGACTNNAKTAEGDLDLENATPEAVVNALAETVESGDAEAVSEAVEDVLEEMKEALEDADVEKATAYASQLEAFVKKNAEKLQELNINTMTINDIVNAVKALPATAQEAAEGAAAAAEADAVAAKDAAVETAKAQADAAVEAGKAKVNETVEEGKAKANEAVQDAADKANKAASDAINEAASKLKL